MTFVAAMGIVQSTASAQQPEASPKHFRYVRSLDVSNSTSDTRQACVLLDASALQHSLPEWKDLRVYRGETEVPYALTLSSAGEEQTTGARLLNLGRRNDRTVFDLEMPERSYSEVELRLDGKNFLAEADVSGSDQPSCGCAADSQAVSLGAFTLFDLSSQQLSRSTAIHLSESRFRYLHISLTKIRPEDVLGAMVPPSREAQTLFSTIASTDKVINAGRQTLADFDVPPQVLIERVQIVAGSNAPNFSREVRVEATAHAVDGSPLRESTDGQIRRVHLVEDGRKLDEENDTVDAVLMANSVQAAHIRVTIENGDDKPLPIEAVRLQMRQRGLCFAAPPGAISASVYYGDAVLAQPSYDYARLFHPAAKPLAAQIGSERPNPAYEPREDSRPFTERHPALLWIALLGALALLAGMALRTAHRLGHPK